MTQTQSVRSNASVDSGHITQGIMNNDTLELNTFEYTDHNALDLEHEIDPDNNFFSTININCHYYTGEQFNRSIKTDGKLSIIHFNSRSLYANFTSIRDYLDTFSQPFNIIAISETWLNKDRELDFDMDGYELSYINRQNKGGGGVAIYVDKTLNFKVLDRMTTVVDNVVECISIEICKEKIKNRRCSKIGWRTFSPTRVTKPFSFVETSILTFLIQINIK